MKKRVSPGARRAINLTQARAASAGWKLLGRCDRRGLANCLPARRRGDLCELQPGPSPGGSTVNVPLLTSPKNLGVFPGDLLGFRTRHHNRRPRGTQNGTASSSSSDPSKRPSSAGPRNTHTGHEPPEWDRGPLSVRPERAFRQATRRSRALFFACRSNDRHAGRPGSS